MKEETEMSTELLVKVVKNELDNAMPDDDVIMDFEGMILLCERLNKEMDVSQAIDVAYIVLSDYERVQRGIIPHW
jgi:hypothetical protein